MIKSMTGFASVTQEDDLVSLTITARTVNHRYLDVQLRVPPTLANLDQDLRTLVQRRVARGRVELTLTARIMTESSVEVDLNEPLVAALAAAADGARRRGWVTAGLTAGDLLRYPQAVTVRELPVGEETRQAVRERVSEGVGRTLDELDCMRCREGEFLRADLSERAAAVREFLDRVVAEAETGAADLREQLSARIGELGGAVQADPAACALEIVKWVSRSDIHEEVSRLRGHLEHLGGLLAGAEPCGRKLDFLVQEMNREINTVGSKAEGRDIGALVVALKAEIEKIREQIQNVE